MMLIMMDFTDIPEIKSLTLSPSIFYNFSKNTNLRWTVNATKEERLGGDITAVNGEENGTHRFLRNKFIQSTIYTANITNQT